MEGLEVLWLASTEDGRLTGFKVQMLSNKLHQWANREALGLLNVAMKVSLFFFVNAMCSNWNLN